MKHNTLDAKIKSMIIALRKKGKSESKDFFVAISEMLDTSRRSRAKVNAYKLDILSKRHKDKVFIVPGTVLGYGIMNAPIKVYAYKYSKGAIEKIKKSKGIAKTFEDLLKDKVESKDIMIIK